MIIDFRLRPPVGGFLDTLMYSAGARRDGFTRTVGFTPSPRSSSPWTCCWGNGGRRRRRGVVVGRLAGVLGSVPNETCARSWPRIRRFIGAASIDPTDRRQACRTIDQALADGFS